jgi:hypothetical protein
MALCVLHAAGVRLPCCLFLASFITACSALAADDPAAPAEPVAESTVAPADDASADIVAEPGQFATITLLQRLQWFDNKTFGIPNLLGSIPGAAIQTLRNQPPEAGSHWEGFGERYGVSVSTRALSNATEAGLGAIWGEDPRYARAGRGPLKSRIGHVLEWTIAAPNRNGKPEPAYARFLAYSSSSWISNSWREPSDTSTEHVFIRVGFAYMDRIAGNAFNEFWPDVKQKLFRRDSQNQASR